MKESFQKSLFYYRNLITCLQILKGYTTVRILKFIEETVDKKILILMSVTTNNYFGFDSFRS